MNKFKCSLCDYSSPYKYNIKNHIKNKNKCSTGTADVVELDTVVINCEYCNNVFSTKRHLNRHYETCKTKKQNLEKRVIELEKELAIAKALSEKPSTINNITTNNNQINNIQIHLTPWNNPTLPDNVEKYYNEALKKLFLSVPTLIKQIHFNKDHPENHNICIKNARSGIAKVYNGKEWESMDEKDVIRTLIDDYESTLTDYASEKNPKYVEKMQKIKDRDSEKKVYDDMHNEVKRVIYDRNHMIKIKK